MGTFMFDRNGNIKRIDTRGVETPDGDILEDILIKDKSGVIDGIDIDTTANTASLILDNGTEIPLTGGGSGGGTITVTANVAAYFDITSSLNRADMLISHGTHTTQDIPYTLYIAKNTSGLTNYKISVSY